MPLRSTTTYIILYFSYSFYTWYIHLRGHKDKQDYNNNMA